MIKKTALFIGICAFSAAVNAKDICLKMLQYGIDDDQHTQFLKINNPKSLKKAGSIVQLTGVHFLPGDPEYSIYPFSSAAYVTNSGTITYSYRGIIVSGADQSLANGTDIIANSNRYLPMDCTMLPAF